MDGYSLWGFSLVLIGAITLVVAGLVLLDRLSKLASRPTPSDRAADVSKLVTLGDWLVRACLCAGGGLICLLSIVVLIKTFC